MQRARVGLLRSRHVFSEGKYPFVSPTISPASAPTETYTSVGNPGRSVLIAEKSCYCHTASAATSVKHPHQRATHNNYPAVLMQTTRIAFSMHEEVEIIDQLFESRFITLITLRNSLTINTMRCLSVLIVGPTTESPSVTSDLSCAALLSFAL
jgi:hypothetical protein